MSEKVLILTHKENSYIKNFIHKVHKESDGRSLTVLSQDNELSIDDVDQFIFNFDELRTLNYPVSRDQIIPGHAHFPLFYYWKQTNTQFDYYWFIEYDVRFNGNWSKLFGSFEKNESDFITAHIKSWHKEPEWAYWDLSHPTDFIDERLRFRSFNPIYRISNEAMSYLNQCFSSGWKGHNEVAFPTLLMHNGMGIVDLNGTGELSLEGKGYCKTTDDRRGSLVAGSYRFRPAMNRIGFRKNTLYHPVKENGDSYLKWLIGDYYRKIRLIFRNTKKYVINNLIDY